MLSHDEVALYLRDTKNPVQLVKHYDDVKNKPDWPLIVQKKYDGVYVLAVSIGGTVQYYSRTGKPLYLEADIMKLHTPVDATEYVVYIGELLNLNISLEVLSGLVNPNRKTAWTEEERLQMVESFVGWHDCLTPEELVSGYSAVPYEERFNRIPVKLDHVDSYLMSDEEEAKSWFDELVADGAEGIVLKNPKGDWKAGRRDGNVMKIVREILMDLECIGVKWGTGKREGQVAALELISPDNSGTFYADFGEGWTDEKRIELTETYLSDLTSVFGIWEVRGLQASSTGAAIRLPKVVRQRNDKEDSDVVRD